MEKINFTDATLTTQAKVTIDGTDYEVTPAVFSGGTDLDADTLNYAFQLMHPVGSIYMTTVATNPADIFGFGTWVAWGSGKVPVGVDTNDTDFDTVEETGGEKKHTLTISEMPAHNHQVPWHQNTGSIRGMYGWNDATSLDTTVTTGNTGGGQAHNNLQPYITCYMWKRTA